MSTKKVFRLSQGRDDGLMKGLEGIRGSHSAAANEGAGAAHEDGSTPHLVDSSAAHWVDRVVDLHVDQCRKWVFNPRHAVVEDRIPELAKLIRELGQLDPIIVCRAPDGVYDILCGQRRWLAIKSSGYNNGIIKAKVTPDGMAFEMLMQLAVESQANTDPLRDVDYALTILALDAEGRNAEMVLGKSKGTISKLRQMGQLPEGVLDLIKESPDKFTMTFGYNLFQVFSKCGTPAAVDFAISIRDRDLTYVDVDSRTKQLTNGQVKQTRRSWTSWGLACAGKNAGALKARDSTGEVSLSLKGVNAKGLERIRAMVDEIVADESMFDVDSLKAAKKDGADD